MKSLVIVLFGILLIFQANAQDYPAEWWKPVPEKDKKSWEILPQEAGPGEVILSKRTELGIFSNFAATRFRLDDENYASVEGLWQMMKYPEGPSDPRSQLNYPFTRDEVKQLVAFEAKEAGTIASKNMKTLGIDWITYKGEKIRYKGEDRDRHYEIIESAILAKVIQNPDIFRLLMQTRGLVLRPDHHQGDNITAAYEYHKILMKIRDQKLVHHK